MAKFCAECGAVRTDGTMCMLCGTPYAQPTLPVPQMQMQAPPPPQPVQAPPPSTNGSMNAPQPPHDPRQISYQRQHSTNSSISSDSSTTRMNGINHSYSYHDDSSTGSSTHHRHPQPQRSKSAGILTGRYADHPNCDLCSVLFDVTRRRHQCRRCGIFMCSSCSPQRMLIPWGDQIDGAKGYDKSIPQRVCLTCIPELRPKQQELVDHFAWANADNNHEAKTRLHVPYTDSLSKECKNAADIIGNFFRSDWGAENDRSIPIALLQKAQGLAIMTIVKAGFVVVGKIGTGLVISRLPDGSWSAPSAIGTVGVGGGFEIGAEIVEIMIILGSASAVKVFHKPQVNLGAGLDIAVGPYGRSAQAAAAVSSSGFNGNYSYSHSRGLYAGISLQGSVIATRNDLNRKFYGQDLEPSQLLSGAVGQPNAAKPLYEAIEKAMQTVEVHKESVAQRAQLMGSCHACNCPLFEAHVIQIWNKKCKTCDHIH